MEGLIYAYHAPRSADQKAYITVRVAQLTAQRHDQLKADDTVDFVTQQFITLRSSHGSGSGQTTGVLRDFRISHDGSTSGASSERAKEQHEHEHYHRPYHYRSVAKIETLVARQLADSSSISSSTTKMTGVALPYQPVITRTISARSTSEQSEKELLDNLFELRQGRRYLRNVPYPLPCDLAEIQRQSLRTLLMVTLFGGPLCSPRWRKDVPKKVLEIGCGSGYWSAICHDRFAERGATNVEFVGLDIAPLAPDHRKQGVNWSFVQHDIRRLPYPFEDEEFDLVMVKDLSMVLPLTALSERILNDAIRLVEKGGTFECWDSDYVLRSMLPDLAPPPARSPDEQDVAEETASFVLAPGHPFTPTQNKYFQKVNQWMTEALDRRKLHPNPCARFAEMMLQESGLEDVKQRRVAIPFGELRWEKNASQKRISNGHDSPMSTGSREKDDRGPLTPDQAALRHTALMTFLQMIESMEPMLKEVSEKTSEEWSTWWSGMMTELLDPAKTALGGECLEIGAWWATKCTGDDDDDEA